MAFETIRTPLERKLTEAIDAASAYFQRPNASGLMLDRPLSRTQVVSRSKARAHVQPRQWCMAYIRWKYPSISYPRIARMFGGFDHTTVLHAERKARKRCPDAIFVIGFSPAKTAALITHRAEIEREEVLGLASLAEPAASAS